jgi:hypothetical protein
MESRSAQNKEPDNVTERCAPAYRGVNRHQSTGIGGTE